MGNISITFICKYVTHFGYSKLLEVIKSNMQDKVKLNFIHTSVLLSIFFMASITFSFFLKGFLLSKRINSLARMSQRLFVLEIIKLNMKKKCEVKIKSLFYKVEHDLAWEILKDNTNSSWNNSNGKSMVEVFVI